MKRLALLLVACGAKQPPAAPRELRIDATRVHGDPGGSETEAFTVRGARMTTRERAITLTDAQLQILTHDAAALLAGAHIAREPIGTSFERWTIHVEVGDRSADCTYVNPTDGDPLYEESGELLSALEDLKPP
jgi:hypothetical protein